VLPTSCDAACHAHAFTGGSVHGLVSRTRTAQGVVAHRFGHVVVRPRCHSPHRSPPPAAGSPPRIHASVSTKGVPVDLGGALGGRACSGHGSRKRLGTWCKVARYAALTTGREEAIAAADRLAGGIAGRGRAARGAARAREQERKRARGAWPRARSSTLSHAGYSRQIPACLTNPPQTPTYVTAPPFRNRCARVDF